MLRNLLSRPAFDSLAANGFNISNNPVCVLSVRWRRKPRWLPTAKSKLFKVPTRPVMPEEEKFEWLRINQNYKTQMRSVRAFFREEVESKKILRAQEMTPADEEAEYQRVSGVNEAWNLKCAQVRDARIARRNAKNREFIQERLDLKKVREAEFMAKIEEKVRKEKESSATFITRETIDQAIEHALANPTDYNFSIDLQGNIYEGSERPGDKKPSEKKDEKVAEP